MARTASGRFVQLVDADYGSPLLIPVRDVAQFTIPLAINLTWTNMPAADTELAGGTVFRVTEDLVFFSQFRLEARVVTAGLAGADLRAQHAPDDTTFANLDGANGPEIAIDATGRVRTAWTNLVEAAQADTVIRVMGKGGDGIVDPVFSLFLHLR